MKARRFLGMVLGLFLFMAPLVPAMASATIIFSDLGPANDVYNRSGGWTVSGSGLQGTSHTVANLFTALTGGNVSQIDLAVTNVERPATFDASIWTNNSGLPGVQVPGALWNGLTSTVPGGFPLVTISGISGVNLTAGESYFMILRPVDITDSSLNAWNDNTQGVTGLALVSNDGGSSWDSYTSVILGAFDILNGTVPGPVPEPSTMLLLGSGLLGLWGARKKFKK